MIYYAEFEYYTKYSTYSSDLSAIGLNPGDFPKGLVPVINSTRTTFESYITDKLGNPGWIIYQDGRITRLRDTSSVK
jgi:hypothetical protein